MVNGASVAIVDDHPIFCLGMAGMLARDDYFQLVAQGTHRDDVVKILSKHRPHILVIDILLRSDGMLALKNAVPYLDGTKVMVLTASEKIEHVSMASTLGVRGFVLKTETAPSLLKAMHAVNNGETYVTPHLAANMFSNMKRRKAAIAIKAQIKSLTKRETEILTCVGRGLTNKEIAIKMGLREKTIKHYMTSIMNKLQVQNRVQAAVLARQAEAKTVTSDNFV